MKKEIFVDDWEERLELQFFSDNPVRKKAYVCSPLSADAEQDYLFNMYAARAYMLYALWNWTILPERRMGICRLSCATGTPMSGRLPYNSV